MTRTQALRARNWGSLRGRYRFSSSSRHPDRICDTPVPIPSQVLHTSIKRPRRDCKAIISPWRERWILLENAWGFLCCPSFLSETVIMVCFIFYHLFVPSLTNIFLIVGLGVEVQHNGFRLCPFLEVAKDEVTKWDQEYLMNWRNRLRYS